MPERQRRQWQPRELKMLSEYLTQEFPETPYKTRVRLGRPQPRAGGKYTREELLAVGVFRRWADALIFLPTNELLLIEAKIRPEPGTVSQIMLYERLIPHTPELLKYSSWNIRKRIVYAIPDPATFMLAREQNIEVVEFRPKWIDEYVKILLPREKSPHRL